MFNTVLNQWRLLFLVVFYTGVLSLFTVSEEWITIAAASFELLPHRHLASPVRSSLTPTCLFTLFLFSFQILVSSPRCFTVFSLFVRLLLMADRVAAVLLEYRYNHVCFAL